MIRRITKNNDLKDLIKSCPTGVIDDIYSIRYYIAGNPDVEIEPTFSKVNDRLEVVIPSSMLENLGNGILMRRALYKAADPEYPDGYYNLEFIDDLNVWLGDEDTPDPYSPYVTEDDLKTINGESLVGDGDIELLTESSLSGYATQSWVSSQGYLTEHQDLSSYATQSYVDSGLSNLSGDINSILNHDYVPYSYFHSELSSYTTKSYVDSGLSSLSNSIGYTLTTMYTSIGYMESVLTSYADKMWVASELEYYASKSLVASYYATKSWVSSQQFATQSWVSSQGYLTSAGLSGYATESYVQEYANSVVLSFGAQLTEDLNTYYVSKASLKTVNGQSLVGTGDVTISVPSLEGYATQSWVSAQGYLTSVVLDGYATESWVISTLSSYVPSLSGYATESWVQEQGYLTSVPSGYATESWVSDQGYLTSVVLDAYATESWVSSNYLPQSDVWTGTVSEWGQLTPEQQAAYKIALVTN